MQVAAARELRDRWLEEVNRESSGYALMSESGKYDVTRPPGVLPAGNAEAMTLLPAA